MKSSVMIFRLKQEGTCFITTVIYEAFPYDLEYIVTEMTIYRVVSFKIRNIH